MKIRHKIILPFLIILVPLLIAGEALFAFYGSRFFKADTYRHLETLGVARANSIDSLLKRQKGKITFASSDAVFRSYLLQAESMDSNMKGSAIETEAVSELKTYLDTYFFEVSLLDKKGDFVLSTTSSFVGQNGFADPFFAQSLTTAHVHDVYFSARHGKPIMSFSAPVTDKNGHFLGVIVANMLPVHFYSLLNPDKSSKDTGWTYAVNANGFMVTPALEMNDDSIILKQEVLTESIRNCRMVKNTRTLAQKYVDYAEMGSYRDYRNISVYGAYTYLPEPDWCVVTEVDQSKVMMPFYLSLLGIFIEGLLLIGLFIFVAYLSSKMILRSIASLQKGVEIVHAGNLDYKMDFQERDEFAALANVFDQITFGIKTMHEDRSQLAKRIESQTSEIEDSKQYLEDQQKAVLNILEDIQEEKIKVEGLAQDLEKFKLAVDNASDQIMITDTDGKILYANKATEQITGFSMAEVIGQKAGGKNLWGGNMKPEFYEKLWNTIKNEKKVYIGDFQNKTKAGKWYDSVVQIAPVLNKNNQVIFFLAIERDVTKEKEVDRAKTEFVSLASHQLRTPLSSINWYAEMLMEGDAGKVTDTQMNYLKEIYNGNQRMVALVNALLNVSRLELGTFIVEPEIVDIRKIADITSQEIKPQLDVKKITFTKEYDPKVPEIKLDKKLTDIIFQNILSNALKYTPEKGKIQLKIKKTAKDVVVSVTDTGYGIPLHQQDKIFSKLFRADNVRQKDTQGTGLGLYMVKSIIEHSGGKIWFKSVEGKGTTFFVSIPLKGMKKKEGSKKLS